MAGKKKSGYDGKIAGLYDLEETIGQGHFAVVKLARHVFTGEKVAVKVIDKHKLDDISRSHLFQEVRCMKLVQHPNVVRLYEVIDTQTKLYLILELGDGDMYDYIMKHNDGLDEILAKKYFRQIVEAILYCHRLHVVHRDLKPENVVFFNKLGIVKLTDFGFSNVFAPGKKLETSCGSLAYSAPEILLGDSYDPPAVDVWSLGVILFMLVAGRAPFQEANDSETLTMIMDCKYEIPPHVSLPCRILISKMLVREPSHRIGLEDIERDQWLASEETKDNRSQINLPLLSREHVSEEDHNYVVQKMVEGKICTREEIFMSLERDAYDHVAATYYLLVERRLRKLQQQQAVAKEALANNLRKQSSPSTSISASKPHLEPLMLSPRRQKDFKKTKTAPIHQIMIAPPTLVITPPLIGHSAMHGMGLPVSPGGSEFVKSLTTSMTLDRRNNQRRRQDQHRVAFSGAQSAGAMPSCASSVSLSAVDDSSKKSQQKAKSAPLVSSSGETVKTAEKKKRPGLSFSKIAILSSFFERKAAQEAGLIPRTPPHQRLFPWSGGKDRKSKQRIALSPNSPTSLDFSEYSIQRTQSSSSEHSDSSSLVQSLVSPPGTHPSPVSASPKMTQLSPDAVFAAVRKCSLIREESHNDDDNDDFDDFEMGTTELKPSRSLELLDERTSELPTYSGQTLDLLSAGGSHENVSPRRPLKSVCSSPQLLNQIHEENESEDEDDFVPLKLSAPHGRYNHGGMASPEILRKYEQRRRRKGAGQRGASCSSSDASDTDDTEGRSRKDKLKHKFMHRRDSSDHSSDTDGPSGGNSMGGGGCLGNRGGGSKPSHRSSRRDGGGGGGGGSGGGGGGGGNSDKSGKSHSKQHGSDISKSSSEDSSDWPQNVPDEPITANECLNFVSIIPEVAGHGSSCTVNPVSKKNQLVRQKPVNGMNMKWDSLEMLDGNFDLLVLTRKLLAVSAASVQSVSRWGDYTDNNNNNTVYNNSKISNVASHFATVVISPAYATPYNEHYSFNNRESDSITQSVEFSEISDYTDGQARVAVCLGNSGLAIPSRHITKNGLTSTFCKVGLGASVVQGESKCCPVV